MEIKGYKEITKEEKRKLKPTQYVWIINESGNKVYFIKEIKFPIVIEDSYRKIEIIKDGTTIYNKISDKEIYFGKDLSEPMLKKLVKKLEEIGR